MKFLKTEMKKKGQNACYCCNSSSIICVAFQPKSWPPWNDRRSGSVHGQNHRTFQVPAKRIPPMYTDTFDRRLHLRSFVYSWLTVYLSQRAGLGLAGRMVIFIVSSGISCSCHTYLFIHIIIRSVFMVTVAHMHMHTQYTSYSYQHLRDSS